MLLLKKLSLAYLASLKIEWFPLTSFSLIFCFNNSSDVRDWI